MQAQARPLSALGGATCASSSRAATFTLGLVGRASCFMSRKTRSSGAERSARRATQSLGTSCSFFFAAMAGHHRIVRRVSRETPRVRSRLMTVPELMLIRGAVLEPRPDRTSAQREVELEDLFASLDLRRFKGSLETRRKRRRRVSPRGPMREPHEDGSRQDTRAVVRRSSRPSLARDPGEPPGPGAPLASLAAPARPCVGPHRRRARARPRRC